MYDSIYLPFPYYINLSFPFISTDPTVTDYNIITLILTVGWPLILNWLSFQSDDNDARALSSTHTADIFLLFCCHHHDFFSVNIINTMNTSLIIIYTRRNIFFLINNPHRSNINIYIYRNQSNLSRERDIQFKYTQL